MPRIFRTLAVSGAAAVAILATAPAATADTPEQAAVVVEAAVDRAAGAPVTLPSGKTLSVRGLDSASYRADGTHHRTVVTLANGAGVGAPIQQTSTQLGTTTQLQTQSGGGAISVTAVVGLALLIVGIFLVKKGKVNGWHAAALVGLGVFLAPTVFGPLIQNLGVSAGGALGNLWTNF